MAFTGLIAPLVPGQDGLNGSRNQSQISPAALLEADNVTYEEGTLRKEAGATKYNSTAISGSPSVMGGWDWYPTLGTQRMVVFTSNGKMLKDSGAGTFTTTLATGLTASGEVVPYFVEGGQEVAANDRKLFCYTGANRVQVLDADGATVASLATGAAGQPADWGSIFPTFGLIHFSRHWGGGNSNAPHTMYYSTATDHENFKGTGSGSIQIYPGEGERLVSAVSFKGFIIAFKRPNGIYAIDTRDNTAANWNVQRLSSRLGAAGPMAIVQIDDDILFIEHDYTVHSISRVTDESFGTRGISDIHDLEPFISQNFNLARSYFTKAVYYHAKREIHVALAGLGDSTNTRRMVIDLNRNDGLPRFRVSSRDVAESIWLKRDADDIQRLVIGDNAGFVWNMDQPVRTKGGGYTGTFRTPHMDLSHVDPNLGARRKNGKWLEVVVEPTGNWDMAVDVYWDNKFHQTVLFNMGSGGAALGSFVIGTDALGGDEVLNRRRRITGSGRRISLQGRNSGDGQDFAVAQMHLGFTLGNDAKQR